MVSYYYTNNPYVMPYTTDQVFNNPYYNPYLPNGGVANQMAPSSNVSTYIPNQSIINLDTYSANKKVLIFQIGIVPTKNESANL